ALRQRLDEAGGVGETRRRLDRFRRGARSAVGDVVAHRRGEEQAVLKHHAHLRAERRERVLAHVARVDQHAPRGGVVQPEHEALARRPVYLAASLTGRKAFFTYARNTMRSPGVIAPCNTNRAPNHSTRAVPSAMSRSTVRSSPADNRVAYAPVARFLRFWRVKACANVPSRERARITLTAPIDSAAAAAMAPCWRRCCRAVSWMRRLRRAVET